VYQKWYGSQIKRMTADTRFSCFNSATFRFQSRNTPLGKLNKYRLVRIDCHRIVITKIATRIHSLLFPVRSLATIILFRLFAVGSFATASTSSQLTLWSRALLERMKIVQLLRNSPAFYGTRTFIIAFTRALQWPPFLTRPIQSYDLSYLRFGLHSCLFLSDFPVNNTYAFLSFPHLCYMTFLSSLT
jgi:hypothetical protein